MDLHLAFGLRGAGVRGRVGTGFTRRRWSIISCRPPHLLLMLLDLLLNENELAEQPLLRDGTVTETGSQSTCLPTNRRTRQSFWEIVGLTLIYCFGNTVVLNLTQL